MLWCVFRLYLIESGRDESVGFINSCKHCVMSELAFDDCLAAAPRSLVPRHWISLIFVGMFLIHDSEESRQRSPMSAISPVDWIIECALGMRRMYALIPSYKLLIGAAVCC